MLTNFDFLKKGAKWLPDDPCTVNRIRSYEDNKKIFNNKHGEVEHYNEAFKRIERIVGNFEEVISFMTIINYQRYVSKKTADLIVGEEPLVSVPDKQDNVEELIEQCDFIPKLWQSVIDLSRFGDTIYSVYNDNETGNFEVIDPSRWIPIVDENNYKKILAHVIWNKYKVGENKYELSVAIHYIGTVEYRKYELNTNFMGISFEIGDMIESYTEETGLDYFAIIHVANMPTSDVLTGYSDYEDINEIVKEILVRVSQISRILDKHASPSVSGPASALMQNPVTGEYELKLGSYFTRDSNDDPNVDYITWDGQLDAAFKHLEFLINTLYTISEMGRTLMGGEEKNSTSMSGRALKFKMLSPLAKAKRMTMFMTSKIKKLVKLLGVYGGAEFDNVSIKWRDGLPDDAVEEAEIIQSRTASNTMSIKRALMEYDNLSEDDAEEEIQNILDEENQMNPLSESPFSGDNEE